MFSTDILPWIILFNDVITLIASSIAFILAFLLSIINCSRKITISFSPTMTVYFIYVSSSALFNVLHYLYLVILWNPKNVYYNAIILYTTGAATTQLQACVPIMEFFLCLDRCFTIMFPGKYSNQKKYITAGVAIITICAVTIMYSIMTQVIELIPTSTVTTCRISGCLKNSSALTQSVIQKSTIAIINCFAAILLGFLMKRRLTTAHSVKKLNQTVFSILIIAFFLDFIPNILAAIALFFKINFTSYLGPYSNSLTSINIAICCCLYWRVFKKSFKLRHFKSLFNDRRFPEVTNSTVQNGAVKIISVKATSVK